ncbi:DELLA protein GAIP [Apostasia shenzhenica]|uniref:DELLA protein GAIP n=1 Tax=Apostasia shenzhenica TaxID=1088818 RepID=A0A2I0ACB2_9ASPA|nr:DELLA protein GAIP [Apostasia shenzhenica]
MRPADGGKDITLNSHGALNFRLKEPALSKGLVTNPYLVDILHSCMAAAREHVECGGGRDYNPPAQSAVEWKGKMRGTQDETDTGMDELLAALGYKVKSSDMAEVAQKLEQLEMAMGSSAAPDDVLLNHLPPTPSTTILRICPTGWRAWSPSSARRLHRCRQRRFTDPTALICRQPHSLHKADLEAACLLRRHRRSDVFQPPAASAKPVVMVDTQDAGIRLVHALMACAEAVQEENYEVADIIVNQISMLAPSQGSAMRKVVGFFTSCVSTVLQWVAHAVRNYVIAEKRRRPPVGRTRRVTAGPANGRMTSPVREDREERERERFGEERERERFGEERG